MVGCGQKGLIIFDFDYDMEKAGTSGSLVLLFWRVWKGVCIVWVLSLIVGFVFCFSKVGILGFNGKKGGRGYRICGPGFLWEKRF